MPDSAITSPRPQLKHRTSFVELDSLESNDPELKKPPKTRFTKDPEGELTYDETTVDVVTVPCPGGDALRSWNRDGLMSRYFGAPSMRDPEVEKTGFAPSWVRQGIRREADVARILLYEHPDVEAGSTLGALADVFLEELRAVRVSDDDGGKMQRQRPLLFLGHSVGGIVVKIALAKASRDARYEDILRDCYGVAFFGESSKWKFRGEGNTNDYQALRIRDLATLPCPVWHLASRVFSSYPSLSRRPLPTIFVLETGC